MKAHGLESAAHIALCESAGLPSVLQRQSGRRNLCG